MTNEDIEQIKSQIIEESEAIFKEGIKKIPQEDLNKLYKEFCRLHGYSMPKSPIDAMIDKATGFEEKRMTEFSVFLMQYIFMPLIEQFQKENENNDK